MLVEPHYDDDPCGCEFHINKGYKDLKHVRQQIIGIQYKSKIKANFCLKEYYVAVSSSCCSRLCLIQFSRRLHERAK